MQPSQVDLTALAEKIDAQAAFLPPWVEVRLPPNEWAASGTYEKEPI